VKVVADKSADAPLPINAKIVRPGSTINSDEWRAYRGLTANEYNQYTLNHSLYFVNTMNGVHKQRIESL
ncbi:hypothetical protein H311_00739, partial [Anncaliia algerae PRA109]